MLCQTLPTASLFITLVLFFPAAVSDIKVAKYKKNSLIPIHLINYWQALWGLLDLCRLWVVSQNIMHCCTWLHHRIATAYCSIWPCRNETVPLGIKQNACASWSHFTLTFPFTCNGFDLALVVYLPHIGTSGNTACAAIGLISNEQNAEIPDLSAAPKKGVGSKWFFGGTQWVQQSPQEVHDGFGSVDSDSDSDSKNAKNGVGSRLDSDSKVGITHLWFCVHVL